MPPVSLVYSNINSYTRKKHLINNFIEANGVQCAMFVETKTSCHSNTSYRNWSFIHHVGVSLHNRARGGSLVLADPTLKMGKANAPHLNNPLNECTHFTVPFREDKLHVFLVYIHPYSRIEENIFTKSSLFKYVLIVGDFNVNNKYKKRQLNSFLSGADFCQYNTPPTFLMPLNRDSTPDILLYSSNIKDVIREVEIFPDLGSDHLSMKILLDLECLVTPFQPPVRYNFAKTNIKKVNQTLLNYVVKNDAMDAENIDKFNLCLSEAIVKNSPVQVDNFYSHKLPPFILQLIRRKRKLYREYRNTNNRELKTELNKFNKNIQSLIQEYKKHLWISTCENINLKKERHSGKILEN